MNRAIKILISAIAVSIFLTLFPQQMTEAKVNGFTDVQDPSLYYYTPVQWAVNMGITTGYKDGEFKPDNQLTRAQMVTFIWRMMGSPEPKTTKNPFSDNKKSDYWYKAALWGNENHIVEGYKDGTFGPKIVCARKHAVTFLWRLAGKPEPRTSENRFSDVKKSDYFYKATLWASEEKILAGYPDGTFGPNKDCLRKHAVTFLYKFCRCDCTVPTPTPVKEPTAAPTAKPTATPTTKPTVTPTTKPTATPKPTATATPTQAPKPEPERLYATTWTAKVKVPVRFSMPNMTNCEYFMYYENITYHLGESDGGDYGFMSKEHYKMVKQHADTKALADSYFGQGTIVGHGDIRVIEETDYRDYVYGFYGDNGFDKIIDKNGNLIPYDDSNPYNEPSNLEAFYKNY